MRIIRKIGFTTSVPVEVIFAAGFVPVDLNNVFISSKRPIEHLERAEKDGFPRNTCAWIKGIYSAMLANPEIDTIIGVVEGDCSNTKALMDVLKTRNTLCIPFAYPYSRDYNLLKAEIEMLTKVFGTNIDNVIRAKSKIDEVRRLLVRVDELTHVENKATGFENHIWQVSASDFNGDYKIFKDSLILAIKQIEMREPNEKALRLGYIGVPPISGEIYNLLENMGARVVFNEVQRQFTMAHGIGEHDLVKVYREYTYPYDLETRIRDIKHEIARRDIKGIIHYVQSFCFRGIEDIIIKKELGVPVLTFEGDRPGGLDARSKLRLEAFVDMIK